LQLLVPLTKSNDVEIQRLSAHALANLSVNAVNQKLMAEEGAIKLLIDLLYCESVLVQRQSSKALANLGVNRYVKIIINNNNINTNSLFFFNFINFICYILK
jgi:hypothetical protein